ncbi:MAG TPA: hypothetical protein DEP66_05785 [Acidimicrobiaceae bacterium]|nr:hypothetical protein [Acidimicrobiaceae bacterium]
MRELRDGLRLARTNRVMLSLLGVTVIANACYFAYFPVVQRIGDRLDATPTQIGVIASMGGFGMIAGSAITAVFVARRWGLAYVLSTFAAMTMLIGFALAPSIALASGALFLAATGIGVFVATQSVLVLICVEEEMRGRAMGLLSMAIGGLPIGTFVLGEVAEVVGARTAVVAMSLVGLAAMSLWLLWHREVVSTRQTDG